MLENVRQIKEKHKNFEGILPSKFHSGGVQKLKLTKKVNES
jgi:hypothetical protein